jgi:hypothetical protein
VLRLKDGKWLVPASRIVKEQLKTSVALDFDTFKRLIEH